MEQRLNYPNPIPVSIPCHLEPYVRFSLIRISDNLLPGAYTVRTLSPFSACHIKPESRAAFAWPSGIACAGVLVICLRVLLALFGHAPSLTSPLSTVEVESLPSDEVMLSSVPLVGLTFRRCKIHVMLRAAVLLSFLRRLQRFSTTGHPRARVACYAAA